MTQELEAEMHAQIARAETQYSDVTQATPADIEASPMLKARFVAFKAMLDACNAELGRETPYGHYRCFEEAK